MALPDPEPGLVLHYSYLWRDEHLVGHEEGRKNRPSVIVLTSKRTDDESIMVIVLPITHSPPRNPAYAVEIPLPVKRNLGIDDERSWVIVTEGNEFVWPGYDLRKSPKTGDYDYGFIPPTFYNKIKATFLAHYAAGNPPTISRG
jgi:hypothetical protein